MERRSDFASPGPDDECSPRVGHDSDVEEDASSPASSNYSSCDGSDLERYCSANSALGSASLCSSVGNYSELLDSLKNYGGLGDDFSSESYTVREKFQRSHGNRDPTNSGGFDGLSDGGVETPRRSGEIENLVISDRVNPLPKIRTGSKLFRNSDATVADNINASRTWSESSSDQEALGAGVSDRISGETSLRCTSACEGEPYFTENLGFALRGVVVEGNEDTSSRYEHSEDEDSMFDYGADDEHRTCLHERKKLQLFKETTPENGNPLLINSSVAFGSDDWDEFVQETGGHETGGYGLASLSLYQDKPDLQQQGHLETDGSVSVTKSQSSIVRVSVPLSKGALQEEDVRDIPVASYQVHVIDQSTEDVRNCPVKNSLGEDEVLCAPKPLAEVYSVESHMNLKYGAAGREIGSVCSEEVAVDVASEKQLFDASELSLTTLCQNTAVESYCSSDRAFQSKELGTREEEKVNAFLPMVKNGQDSSVGRIMAEAPYPTKLSDEGLSLDEVKRLNTNDSYDEMVLEMEEILLDSGESHGAMLTHGNRASHHFRDGSSSASTSGTDDAYPLVRYPPQIDWVEIVGAKQKKGDVSFGERLVGVKEYTVYKLKVRSGKDQWEVERRYRDFFALFCKLKSLYTDHALSLPSPWSNVERESRKIFGNASPSVISERSSLIQDCLRSILHSRSPFGTSSHLAWFLSPGEANCNSGLLTALVPQSLQKPREDEKQKFPYCGETHSEDVSTLGKTIALVVEIKPHKSMRQLLEAQHYTCAGCHRHLDAGKTFLRELAKTFGWNKPRFCEYTGQLFCASCHTNDTAVLPARVLHTWDFSLYPVSQLAKAYLESIYDQPMLCVSAVNPFLFSKVPALLHVMGIRKKIGAMFPYIRCPFRRSIQRGLGYRRHLLESNDFFALRDLVDLSKGAFAALPVMVETISSKIHEHITQQCLLCYDAGIPCSARQACDDPASLIFPFQEAEATRCSSCGSIFHKPCFGKLTGCPCGKPTSSNSREGPAEQETHESGNELDGVLNRPTQPGDSKTASGFFSDIFSKARPDKIWKPKNNNPVILMGSLPSSSL